MTNLVFPSEEFPAQPGVTLQIPDDWQSVHTPGAVMAARRGTEDGTFTPNIVVRIDRRPAGFEITEALGELKRFAADRPQGTTSEPFKAELDGQLFVGCDLSWVDDQAGTVLQAHLFGGIPTGPFIQLVQITGSVGGAQAREDYPAVQAIMKSLRVSPPESGAGGS